MSLFKLHALLKITDRKRDSLDDDCMLATIQLERGGGQDSVEMAMC
jgi:hypothetical protein